MSITLFLTIQTTDSSLALIRWTVTSEIFLFCRAPCLSVQLRITSVLRQKMLIALPGYYRAFQWNINKNREHIKLSCPCIVFPHEDHNALQLFWRETVTISRKEAVSDDSGRKTKVCTGSARSYFSWWKLSLEWWQTPPTSNVDDLQAVKERSIMKKKVAFLAHLEWKNSRELNFAIYRSVSCTCFFDS